MCGLKINNKNQGVDHLEMIIVNFMVFLLPSKHDNELYMFIDKPPRIICHNHLVLLENNINHLHLKKQQQMFQIWPTAFYRCKDHPLCSILVIVNAYSTLQDISFQYYHISFIIHTFTVKSVFPQIFTDSLQRSQERNFINLPKYQLLVWFQHQTFLLLWLFINILIFF